MIGMDGRDTDGLRREMIKRDTLQRRRDAKETQIMKNEIEERKGRHCRFFLYYYYK